MLTLNPSLVKVAAERVRDRLNGLATPSRLLRWSIGSIYLWFGALKLLNASPAVPLIGDAFPLFIDGPLYLALALFEALVGILLLGGLWTRWVIQAAVVHLLGTLATLVLTPSIVFLTRFPYLSMEGEFVVKNVVLLAALYTIWKLEVQAPDEEEVARTSQVR